jgi:hypothetical protein
MGKRIVKGGASVIAAILFVSNIFQKYSLLGVPYFFLQEHWHLFWFRTVVLGLLIPAPFTYEIIARIRPRIKVNPSPSGKGNPAIYLNVLNESGGVKTFNAKCEVLDTRHDPNAFPSGIYDLKWDHTFDRKVSFSKHDSLNLLIATIAGPSENPKLSLCALDGLKTSERGGFSWSVLDKRELPEYDLQITILSDVAIEPQRYRFTLRPHISRTYVEMVPLGKDVSV